MRLWGKGTENRESVEEFWRTTAEKRGGEVGLITFATYLGRSGDEILGLPGLLYTVGDAVWFEDFEKDNWMSRLLGAKRRYEKTELGFNKPDVAFTRLVSRPTAFRCIRGGLPSEKTHAVSPLGIFFSVPAVQVCFSQGHSLFFEVMRRDELVRFLK
jgi:hypothetical protein